MIVDINECIPLVLITVTLMLSVPTPLVASPVPVMMATVEMDSPVWVSKSHGPSMGTLVFNYTTADVNAGCTNTSCACMRILGYSRNITIIHCIVLWQLELDS